MIMCRRTLCKTNIFLTYLPKTAAPPLLRRIISPYGNSWHSIYSSPPTVAPSSDPRRPTSNDPPALRRLILARTTPLGLHYERRKAP